jgi:hypothetical protein
MFKLVAVGGRLRGKEFVLEEGENTIGRAQECSISLLVDGISKKHLKVTVNNDTVFAEDLGSSNGTLVNEKPITKATLKDGDKIVLPNVILQLVYVIEKKIVIKKKVLKDGGEDDLYDDLDQPEPIPQSLLAKPIWFFKNKVMPIVYSFNEQYEWSALVGILLFVFIAINIALTILPVLRDSRDLLINEIALRGKQYAAEVDRYNNIYLGSKNLDQVNTSFLESADAEGVKSYRLFDPEGRVIRPIAELNTITSDPFDNDAKNFFRLEKNQDELYLRGIGSNTIGIARPIKAHDKSLGRDMVVGIIAIKFSPSSLAREASNNQKAYLESLVTSAMVAIIFFGLLYYMTTKPLEDMRKQIERVLRGRQKELQSRQLWKEVIPLRNSINSMLSRIRDLQNTDMGNMTEIEEDGPYIRTLHEFMLGAQGPVMILNSEKVIQNINPECEDLIGLRENASQGLSILDTARDQGFAATIIDLCDKSANNEGCNQKETYDIGGKEVEINVATIIGKDKFAKGFYITFVRNT